MGGTGVPGTPDDIQNLKTSLPAEWWCHTDLIIKIQLNMHTVNLKF
jgi:hypothetical protein